MISYRNYVAGWLDSSIHDFFGAFPRKFSSLEFALITCVDSNPDPASLLETSPALKSLATEARPLGRGLLVPTRRLLEIEAGDQIFFGFDEVWFFPGSVVEPKPESVCLVGPARPDQRALDRIGGWMSANDCSLGFGDGEGLNFIVKARGLVRHLLGHSVSQPEPGSRDELVFQEEGSRSLAV